jgi:hypothetical protein
MVLPKSIQAELDAAEALQAALNGDPAGQTVASDDPTPSTPSTPAIEVVPPEVSEETWAQKYKTLQAKFDAEVPRLHAKLRDVNSAMQQKVRENAELVQANAAAPRVESAFSDKDKEEYGEDLIALLERNSSVYLARIAELEARLNAQHEAVGNVEQIAAAQAEERFFSQVRGTVPDWEQINESHGWVEWLSGRFPGSGATRQEMLNASRSGLDSLAVTELFQAYKSTLAKPNQGTRDLQRQVAPAKGGAAQTPVDSGQRRIWTSAEVSSALDPRKLAKLPPAERDRVMTEIDSAAAEGRVLP